MKSIVALSLTSLITISASAQRVSAPIVPDPAMTPADPIVSMIPLLTSLNGKISHHRGGWNGK